MHTRSAEGGREERENEVPKEGSAKRPGRWKETTRVFGRREQVMKKKASRRWHRRSGPGIRSKSYSSQRERHGDEGVIGGVSC